MVRINTLLVSGLSLLGTALAGSSVIDLIPDNFDKVVLKSGKPSLVEIFAPWCGHCKNLAPVWEELATTFAHASDKVNIAKLDGDEHKALSKRFGVQGFPTLKWFDGKSDKPVDYTGGRDLESLTKWIQDKSGAKARTNAKKAAPSPVEMLSDKTFSEKIGKDQDVLVAFTAPWCGHCKSLAPTWESLAADFAAEPSVLIAKIDTEAENSKATAKSQGVSSYPTIKFFPKGSTEPQEYEGSRAEKDFVHFINEKAGTHRAVGGGLDAAAGTVEALDSIVQKLTGGSDIADVAEELKKAAVDLKGKSSEYYIKVLSKIQGSKGYAEKELARLEGILAKGGLAPEKVDDLTSRTNVLRKFTSSAGGKDEL